MASYLAVALSFRYSRLLKQPDQDHNKFNAQLYVAYNSMKAVGRTSAANAIGVISNSSYTIGSSHSSSSSTSWQQLVAVTAGSS